MMSFQARLALLISTIKAAYNGLNGRVSALENAGGGGGVILNIDGGNASSIAPVATAINGGTA